MRYILDSNIVSALIRNRPEVHGNLRLHANDEVYLCQPVYYEVSRGLLWKQATAKILILQRLRTQLDWTTLEDEDWQQAAQWWAYATSNGKQLSDMDFLIAAITKRLNAILVTDDADFAALPITRENWTEV